MSTKSESYQDLHKSRTAKKQQDLLIEVLKRNTGGLTRTELSIRAGVSINATCGRIAELLMQKRVQISGTRLCNVTSRTVQVVQVVKGAVCLMCSATSAAECEGCLSWRLYAEST
jgi:hypothetical protein